MNHTKMFAGSLPLLFTNNDGESAGLRIADQVFISISSLGFYLSNFWAFA